MSKLQLGEALPAASPIVTDGPSQSIVAHIDLLQLREA